MSTPEQTPEALKRAKRANWVHRLVRPLRIWLNAATADEGCTMVDARRLREYNHGLAEENERLREENTKLRRVGARWRTAWRDEMKRRIQIQNISLPNIGMSHGEDGPRQKL